MKILLALVFVLAFICYIAVAVTSVTASSSSSSSPSLTSSCLSSGAASKQSTFPTFSPNDISLSNIDTATILQQRGCNPSRPWRYAVATQPPTLSDQQLAFPNTLSTWSVDPLSGVVRFSAGSSEGVNTIVEKLECTATSNNQPLDACVITHQVMVYNQNLDVPSSTSAAAAGTPTSSAAPSTTSSSGNQQHRIGPCSPVYGFSVPTDNNNKPFTASVDGFAGETECPSGLTASYELVQAPSKSAASPPFSFDVATGSFSYTVDASTSTFDNDFFRFTKRCGTYAYCSAVAYLVLQPSSHNNNNGGGQQSTTAASPATLARCPDVYYFTTNQPLTLGGVNGGFSCGTTTAMKMEYSLFNNGDNSGIVSIKDATTGEFIINNNNGNPIPTNAAGWTDFDFTAQCSSSSSSSTTSCIGTAHLMVLPSSNGGTTNSPNQQQTCPTVSTRWSPSMTTPLKLDTTDENNNNCLFTITSQPDFVSVALDQSTGNFRLTFADSVKSPVGWLMFTYSRSCSSSSTTCSNGLAYVQALPATTALPTTAAPPTTTSACPTTSSQTQVFYWNNQEQNTSPFQLISSPSCSNFKIDYDSTRPIPPITLSTASGLFTFSSSSTPQGGWTNFTYSFNCGDYDAALCHGSAAVWVQPTITSSAPSDSTTVAPEQQPDVCASSNINFLFSYIWRLGTTQSLNLKSSGNNQQGNQSLVDSTSSSVCSQFGSFDVIAPTDASQLFVVDSSASVITLNSTYNRNIEAGWKHYSLLVSCQAPQAFTCMTRLSILMITPADHHQNPSSSTATPSTSSSSAGNTTTQTENNGGGGVIENPGETTTQQQQQSSTSAVAPPPVTNGETTTSAPSSSSPYLSVFTNFQCAGTCNQESWKTVSFLPDLWDVSPPGGVTLDPSGNNKDVTNPPHIQRADGRPIDDIRVTYDALTAPEEVQLSATGAIGNMGVRFPTFESLSSASSNDSSTSTALPGRLTSSNVLSRASPSSLPFDVDCLDKQSSTHGVAEQIWQWDDLDQLQGHGVEGEYNGGNTNAPPSNYYQKFGGKHEQCNTMKSRENSCKYSPLLTPSQKSDSADSINWKLDVSGCDLTWVASNVNSKSILNSQKKQQQPLFSSSMKSSSSSASSITDESSSSSNALPTETLTATIFSEAVKPASWTSPARGTLVRDTEYTLPVQVSQWLTATRDGASVHRTSFAVRSLSMQMSSSSSSSTVSITLSLVAPSSVGAVFSPAIRGVEIDSLKTSSSCQFEKNNQKSANFNSIVSASLGAATNSSSTPFVLPLPAPLTKNATDCADSSPFPAVRLIPVTKTVVSNSNANSTSFAATIEPVTTFRIELDRAATSATKSFFEGTVAIRLLFSTSATNFWVERFLIEGGTGVTGLGATTSSSSSSSSTPSSAVPTSTSDAMKSMSISACNGAPVVMPYEVDKYIVMGEDEKDEEESAEVEYEGDVITTTAKPGPYKKRTLIGSFSSASELGAQVCRGDRGASTSSGAVVPGSDSFTIAASSTALATGSVTPRFEYLIVSQIGGAGEQQQGFRLAVVASPAAMQSTDENGTPLLLPISKVAPFAPVTVHKTNRTSEITAISINNIGSLCPRNNRETKSCRLRFDVGVVSSSSSSSVYSRSFFVFVDNELDSLALNNTASWQANVDLLPNRLITPPVVTRIDDATAVGYGAIVAVVGAIALVLIIVIYIDKKSAKSAVKNFLVDQPLKVAEFVTDFMFKSNNVKFSDEEEYELANKRNKEKAKAKMESSSSTATKTSDTTSSNAKTTGKALVEEMQQKAQVAIEEARKANTPPRQQSPAKQKRDKNVPSIVGIPPKTPTTGEHRFGESTKRQNDDDDLISASSVEASHRHQESQQQQKKKQQQQSSPTTAVEVSSPSPSKPSADATAHDDDDPLYQSP